MIAGINCLHIADPAVEPQVFFMRQRFDIASLHRREEIPVHFHIFSENDLSLVARPLL